MRQRLWWILIPTLASAAITAIVCYYFMPTRYQAETVILVVPQRVPESYVRATVTTRIDDRLQSLRQQILSRARLERIIQDFNLYATERKTGIMEDIVEKMRRVTERLASLFIEENLKDREALAEGTSQFLEAQIADTRRQIIEKEAELKTLHANASGAPVSEADLLRTRS